MSLITRFGKIPRLRLVSQMRFRAPARSADRSAAALPRNAACVSSPKGGTHRAIGRPHGATLSTTAWPLPRSTAFGPAAGAVDARFEIDAGIGKKSEIALMGGQPVVAVVAVLDQQLPVSAGTVGLLARRRSSFPFRTGRRPDPDTRARRPDIRTSSRRHAIEAHENKPR